MEINPLFRFYIDNKKYLPGILTIVGISLLSGVLKMLAATFWGRAVDLGMAGLINDMIFAAIMMAVFILADCLRTAVHYHIIGRITENMFMACGPWPFTISPKATLLFLKTISAQGT